MKQIASKAAIMVAIATLLPLLSQAQDTSAGVNSLEGILNGLYNQMLPLCSQLIDVSRGIAGFAALWFIALRVWRHIAAAEPVDFYPLLRPFALGMCIMAFPAVLSLINGVLQPTVTATAAMVGNGNAVITNLTDVTKQNDNTAMPSQNNPDKWYGYSAPDNTSGTSTTAQSNMADQVTGWGVRAWVEKAVAYILNLCFEAAALCIDTIRTFKLIVLSILGPLVFGLSVFDGFQHTLKQWLARYVNVFMWLPVCNIFGAILAKIQANMILLQQSGAASNSSAINGNTIYLIFLIMGIVGYFTVPSIANYIVNAGGHALLGKTTALASSVISFGTGIAMQQFMQRPPEPKIDPPKEPGSGGGNTQYMSSKLSGKP